MTRAGASLVRAMLLVALASLASVGCAKRDAGAPQCVPDDAAVVDTELMAFLSAARALHHEANVREDGGDLPAAIAAIERIAGLVRPHATAAGATLPEVAEVVADAYARLAELRLRARDVAGASRAVAEGLKLSPDATYFRGHLLEIDGVVLEARALDLADAGRTGEATEARAQAVRVLGEAVAVQEKVIKHALEARDGGTP